MTQRGAGRWPTKAVAAPRRRRTAERLKEYLFILPALLVLAAVILFPTLWAIYLSLYHVVLVPPDQAFMGFELSFAGLANYLEAVQDRDFWLSFQNTALFTVAIVGGALLLGLMLALLLNQRSRGKRLWRVLLLIPWVISGVVVGSTWRWMYEPRYGVLNDLWQRVFPGAAPILWLARPALARVSVCIASIWARTPYMTIMLLAGLQAIPAEQYEAAAVDGASGWQRFRHVTLPHLRQIIMVATVLQTIWSFRSFDIVQVLTQGGPGRATDVLSTYVYKTSFVFFRFGFSSAIAVCMMAVLLAFAVFYTRMLGRE